MSSMKNYGLTGVASDVQFGKAGGHVKWNSTHFEVKDASNADAELRVAATPTDVKSATSKQYVDDQIQQYIQGLDVKQSVHVATTGPITLSGTQTIDGVAVTAGMRVLVKNQSTASQNGIYVAAAGAWSRAADADNSPYAEVSGGMFTFVEAGGQADTGWVLTSPEGVASLGVDSLIFTQFSGAGTYSAGNGLSLTGTTFSANINSGSVLTNTAGGNKLDITGATANQVLMSGSQASFAYLGDLRDSNGAKTASSTAGSGTIVNWVNFTNAGASQSVKIGVGGSGAGSTNTDLELSAAGTGLIIAPSGYDMSAGPNNSLATKGYVDSVVDAGNWHIVDVGGDTYVRTATGPTNDTLNKVEIGTGTQGGKIAEFSGATGSPNYFNFSSVTTSNEEVRIEAKGSAADVDIRLVPKGAGQVFIGDVGDGVIQADNTYNLHLLGGDGIGGAAGDVILTGGAGSGANPSGDVIIRQATGGSADGAILVQDFAQSKIATFAGVASADSFLDITNGVATTTIASNGTPSNIDITLDPKGTGQILAGTGYVPTASLALVTKAYVDANNQFTISDGTNTSSIDSGDTFTIIGGTNLTSTVSGDQVTIDMDSSISLAGSLSVGTTSTFGGVSTFNAAVSISGSNTFTVGTGLASFGGNVSITGNQTVVGTASVTGATTLSGDLTLNDGNNNGSVVIASNGTGTNIDLVLDPKGTGFVMAPSGYSLTGAPATAFTTKAYVDAAVSGSNQFNLTGDTGTTVIDANDTMTVIGGTNITTSVSGDNLTIDLDSSISLAGSLSVGTTSTFGGVSTHNAAVSITGANTFTVGTGLASFGGAVSITGNLAVVGNTLLNGDVGLGNASADLITINGKVADTIVMLDNDANGSVTIATSASTVTNVDLVLDPAGTGLVIAPSGYNMSSGPATAFATKAYVDNAVSSNNQFTLAGDSGTTTIDANDTMTVAGGTNITSVVSGDTVTLNLDSSITLAGTLEVTGATTMNGNVTLGDAAGDVITVGGTSTFNANVTVSGSNTFTVGSGAASFGGNVSITGNQTVVGNTVMNGNVTLGDTAGDVITMNGQVADSIAIKDSNNNGEVVISTVAGTATNVDLVLDPAGTGIVMAPSGYDMSTGPSTSFTTKGYVDNAITTNTDMLTLRKAFSQADVSSNAITVGVVPNIAGKDYYVTTVRVKITTPVASGNGNVTITDSTNTLVTASEMDFETAGSYLVQLDGTYSSDNGTIKIDGFGASPGTFAGTIIVEYKAVSGT